MTRLLFIGIPLILGIIIGTQLNLWIQGIIVLSGIIYLNSSHVAAMEIGAIFPYLLFVILCIGMVLGDVSYFYQTDGFSNINLSNPFKV